MLIRPTGLTLVEIFFWIVPMAVRLIGLISIKTKEYSLWSPLWKWSILNPNYDNVFFSLTIININIVIIIIIIIIIIM